MKKNEILNDLIKFCALNMSCDVCPVNSTCGYYLCKIEYYDQKYCENHLKISIVEAEK